ncbi:MAG: hypothetical protein J0M02_05190 [Planctomycetes bacterium]|nr:hypothetical protein [Planctomycetota bacterium]
MRLPFATIAILGTVLSVYAGEDVVARTIAVDASQAAKDLTNCQLGANAQQFRIHYSIKKMLDSGLFAGFMQDIGRPVIRLDGRSIYGWSGRGETWKLRDAETRLRLLKQSKAGEDPAYKLFQPGDFDALAERFGIDAKPERFVITRNHPDIAWFSPEEFHRFCRANGIRLIGAINDHLYYQPESGQVFRFRDNPGYFDGAVDDFRRKLTWVKDNGYLDLYVAWEIGNECWSSWDPVLYAQYARKILAAARALQPDIRLAVPVMLRNTDDPAIQEFIAKDHRRQGWFDWHESMLPALGDDIRGFSHLQIHVYGSASRYSANQRGLDNIAEILAKTPGTDHFRYLVTEWRYTGVGGTQHRTFRTGALWNAKFAMTLLAHPRVDWSAAHEFLCTSGLGYWTPGTGNAGPNQDGSEWMFQTPDGVGEGKPGELRSTHGRPSFDVGPFGPVNRMLNELMRECPLLIEHRADLGPMSSALFAEGAGDLHWFICRSGDGSTIGGMVVNTCAQSIDLELRSGDSPLAVRSAELMSCAADRLAIPEVPGEAKAWRVEAIQAHEGRLRMPTNSILVFRAGARQTGPAEAAER